jgi:hypothetical protein
MPPCPFFGRYRGESGSDSDIVKPTRLTRLGHRPKGAAHLGGTDFQSEVAIVMC